MFSSFVTEMLWFLVMNAVSLSRFRCDESQEGSLFIVAVLNSVSVCPEQKRPVFPFFLSVWAKAGIPTLQFCPGCPCLRFLRFLCLGNCSYTFMVCIYKKQGTTNNKKKNEKKKKHVEIVYLLKIKTLFCIKEMIYNACHGLQSTYCRVTLHTVSYCFFHS